MSACPFCDIAASRVLAENAVGVAVADGFPVTDGHALVVPRTHVASLFELSPEDQTAIWQLVAEVRTRLQESHQPDGFNIGVNDGTAAGQTVMHAHVHIIPRYKGDADDPRGGIRWIAPQKARYW